MNRFLGLCALVVACLAIAASADANHCAPRTERPVQQVRNAISAEKAIAATDRAGKCAAARRLSTRVRAVEKMVDTVPAHCNHKGQPTRSQEPAIRNYRKMVDAKIKEHCS